MKPSTFLKFIAPSFISMLILILVPLLGVGWLALHKEKTVTKQVETIVETPLFGGMVRKTKRIFPQAVLDEEGNPIRYYEYVGFENLADVIRPDSLAAAWQTAGQKGDSLWQQAALLYREITKIQFWGALEFTLLYTFVTLFFILTLGFITAWVIHNFLQRFRGLFVFTSLLPFIITPIVGALSIYWLFLDDAIVAALLEELGMGRFYFLSDKLTIRGLIIFYGIWHSMPFAFIVLFAGLQTVPNDSLEAAKIDGATTLQQVRLVVIPHLIPLFIFITLIHVMDAYRVFEPILVFGSALFADSLQHFTYSILAEESNYGKAAASAILTVIGICLLLMPVLRRTWKEQKELRS